MQINTLTILEFENTSIVTRLTYYDLSSTQNSQRWIKGAVTQVEKALVKDCVRVSKSLKFHIPTIYNFVVIYP